MSYSSAQLQEMFIQWLLLPEVRRGDINSEAEWARRHGVSDRTLRRWKTTPKFVEAMADAQAAPPATSSAAPPAEPTSLDEADYRVVKTALVEGAKSGNPKYLDLYFKTYGKPFVEEEVASRATDLAGMDMEDLVARALATLNPEPMISALRALGWRVEK
jgi:hypothetical protein